MKKILVIDDDYIDVAAIENELRNYGLDAEAKWVQFPENALNILAELHIDIIILDIIMPVPDNWAEEDKRECNKGLSTGIVLLRKIKDKFSDLPVILYTSIGNIPIPYKNTKHICRPVLAKELVGELIKMMKLAPMKSQ